MPRGHSGSRLATHRGLCRSCAAARARRAWTGPIRVEPSADAHRGETPTLAQPARAAHVLRRLWRAARPARLGRTPVRLTPVPAPQGCPIWERRTPAGREDHLADVPSGRHHSLRQPKQPRRPLARRAWRSEDYARVAAPTKTMPPIRLWICPWPRNPWCESSSANSSASKRSTRGWSVNVRKTHESSMCRGTSSKSN
jgi:hypothetical protein